jgi:hypothetical protein
MEILDDQSLRPFDRNSDMPLCVDAMRWRHSDLHGMLCDGDWRRIEREGR